MIFKLIADANLIVNVINWMNTQSDTLQMCGTERDEYMCKELSCLNNVAVTLEPSFERVCKEKICSFNTSANTAKTF